MNSCAVWVEWRGRQHPVEEYAGYKMVVRGVYEGCVRGV